MVSITSVNSTVFKRDLTLFLTFQFFAHLEFFNGLFVVFLAQQGIHMTTIHLCFVATTTARVLGEFPSGYLGDRWGDRLMLLWGMALMIVFAACLPYIKVATALIVCFSLHGLSIAATSGADDGMLYRTVLQGNDQLLERVRPWVSGANYLSLATAALIGGALAQLLGWQAVFWGFCLAAAVSVGALLAIRSQSTVRRKQAAEATSLHGLFERLKGHRRLFSFVSSVALIEACANLVFIYTQVQFERNGMSMLLIGMAMAGVEIVSALGAVASRWIKLGQKSYALSLLAGVGGLMVAALPGKHVAALGILLFLFIAAVVKVSAETILITRIDTELTASSLSFFSLLIAALTGFLHLFFAAMGDVFSVAKTMLLLASITFLSSLWSLWSGYILLRSEPNQELVQRRAT